MNKFFTSALFIMLLISCIMMTGVVLRPYNIDMSLSQIETFHSLENNSLDVIAYGSSRCWRGFSTVEFQNKFNVKAYNYGNNWQRINTTWLFFKDSLRTQNPQVIFIETGLLAFPLLDEDMTGEIYYTRKIPWSEYKKKYLEQCFGNKMERYLSYFIPFVSFHSNWESLTKIDFGKAAKDTSSFTQYLGYVAIDDVTPITITYNEDHEEKEPGNVSMEILNDIVATCKEKNITLVLYTAPHEGEYNYCNFLEKYAVENGCYYINLFDNLEEAGINQETDFCDPGHLNNAGAVKVADFLGNYLIENGLMPK